MTSPSAPAPGVLVVGAAGTEYRLAMPHLLPQAIDPSSMLAEARRLLGISTDATASPAAAQSRSRAAFMLLCAGRAAEARVVLLEAIQAQRAFRDEKSLTSSELRLVQVLQQLDRPIEAVALARKTLARHDARSDMRHYALHHLGKALLQSGSCVEARVNRTGFRGGLLA